MTFVTQKKIIILEKILAIYIYYIMSMIPVQNLIIDDDTDIGLTSDLMNGTYKSSSLTDLSNNSCSKITDLSSNVYTQLNNSDQVVGRVLKRLSMSHKVDLKCAV